MARNTHQLDKIEKGLGDLAHFFLVRLNACCFLILLVIYTIVLFRSGVVGILYEPAGANVGDKATIALALTGIAALVGASLASYEMQRSTKHARRAAQATFLLELEGRFMSPELREAQDALREIWTQADGYFKLVSTDSAASRRMHDPISKRALENWLRDRDRSHKLEFLSRHIAHQLNHLKSTNEHMYHVLLRSCEIFENYRSNA